MPTWGGPLPAWRQAGGFGLTLDESWAQVADKPQWEVDDWLYEAGVWDPTLTPMERQERYVRFQGVEFGVAPRDV